MTKKNSIRDLLDALRKGGEAKFFNQVVIDDFMAMNTDDRLELLFLLTLAGLGGTIKHLQEDLGKLDEKLGRRSPPAETQANEDTIPSG